MGVAFDQVSSASGDGVTSVSWTHTPVGTPTAVACSVGVALGAGTAPTGITYGGAALTMAQNQISASSEAVSVWGLANLSAGAAGVVVSFAASTYLDCEAITVTGSDTTTCFSNSAKATALSGTASVNCVSATDELVIDGLELNNSTAVTAGGGQTQRWSKLFAFNLRRHAGSTKAGATSVTMSWTFSQDTWAIVAASFKAAAAGGVFMPGVGGSALPNMDVTL